MIKNLNMKFMEEISRINAPEIFIGLARVLKVQLMEDKDTPRDFIDVFSDCVEKFNGLGRTRKKELLKILRDANKAKIEESGKDGDRAEDSKA